MAKQAARAAAGGKAGKGKAGKAGKGGRTATARKSGSSKLLWLLCLIAVVPFSLPTLIVLFVGMMPTLGAMLSDRTGNRYSWMCIGGLNFAGLSKWLLDLWFGHHDFASAWSTATDLTMLFCAYGAAVCGWVLYLAIPPVILAIQTGSMSRRAGTLAAAQKKIIEQWGDDVRRAGRAE